MVKREMNNYLFEDIIFENKKINHDMSENDFKFLFCTICTKVKECKFKRVKKCMDENGY